MIELIPMAERFFKDRTLVVRGSETHHRAENANSHPLLKFGGLPSKLFPGAERKLGDFERNWCLIGDR